ncbi:YdcF family protein [Vibrio sp. S11_S32]|uniref:YdcF family protein n=1 Tax=Vibrio sp. S11_S32 TaxID=2720225 RepID=UPI001681200E|nr:YdcF family protein [Vibrio sp. S11_S32]MBD1577755.1 YdcF family protein [Vibrio sp. S11_S32]
MSGYYNQVLAVWNYLQLKQDIQPSDAILLLGSSDLRVGERVAELYHQGIAPRVIISGGLGRMTDDLFPQSEAEMFAKVVMDCGVPCEAILLESQSTNTGENLIFTEQLIVEQGIKLNSVTLVQKPYMERRALACCEQLWPQVNAQVTSPQFPNFIDYCNTLHPSCDVINLMVGELQRIELYPNQGFFKPQPWPENMTQIMQSLIAIGYDEHLIA